MRLGPTEAQEALRRGVREFAERRVPLERLAALEGEADRALFRELAELGVFALRVPEKDGGLGLGMAEAVLCAAELGRRLVPGPVLWTSLAAGLVDGAVEGRVLVTGIAEGWVEREAVLVEHATVADALLILRPGGIACVDARAIESDAREPLDPLTPVSLVRELPAGERIGGRDEARKMRLDGATLAAAELLGNAAATLELAVAYAKTREQFGRPIGSFQAVKHILADMFVRREVARAAVYAAAATLDHPEVGDVERAVASAKLEAGRAALDNARACIQVHGGMGYTWEVPAHYYLKRALVLENAFGTRAEHAELLAGTLARNP